MSLPPVAAGNPLRLDGPLRLRPVPPVPADPALPALAALVDGRQVAQLLQPLVGTHLEVAPRYARYKALNKATFLYDVAAGERRTAVVVTVAALRDLRKVLARPETEQLAAAARPRCLSDTPVAFLDEPAILVEWYPARVGLPGMAADPRHLVEPGLEAVAAAGAPDEPTLVSYKPERRAVLRWGRTYMKAYLGEADYRAAVVGLRASGPLAGMGAPALLAQVDDLRLTFQAEVDGREGASPRELGDVLARLHGCRPSCRLDEQLAADHLAGAASTAEQVGWLVPALREPVSALVADLRRTAPDPGPLVLSHGDLHLDQALGDGDTVRLVDFDHLCMADSGHDPATLAAHLVNGAEGELERAIGVLDEVLAGYGQRPPALAWHLAVEILRRATYPFRLLEVDWPARLARMVDDARRALRS